MKLVIRPRVVTIFASGVQEATIMVKLEPFESYMFVGPMFREETPLVGPEGPKRDRAALLLELEARWWFVKLRVGQALDRFRFLLRNLYRRRS